MQNKRFCITLESIDLRFMSHLIWTVKINCWQKLSESFSHTSDLWYLMYFTLGFSELYYLATFWWPYVECNQNIVLEYRLFKMFLMKHKYIMFSVTCTHTTAATVEVELHNNKSYRQSSWSSHLKHFASW